MNILHLSTFQQQGGAAIAAIRLHEALLKNQVDSSVLVQKRNSAAPNVACWDDSAIHRNLYWGYFIAERLSFLPFEKNKEVRYAFSPARFGVDISNSPLVKNADIIQLHWVHFGFLSLDSLRQLIDLGKPIVWTLHDMWAFTGGCHYSRNCERFLSTCQFCPYLKKPSEYDISFQIFQDKLQMYEQQNITLVSPSHWLKNLATAATLTKQLQTRAIPNAINTNFYFPHHKPSVRKKLGLPEDKKLILFVGANTMDPRKGFHYFKEAINQLYTQNDDFDIVVFGKSEIEIIDSLKPHTHNLGSLSDPSKIVEVYAACDLLVAPSLEDNLPNTIMESMACGTPVVGFNTGGIPEMIDHQQNGYVADYLSVASLKEGIQWVLEHPENLSENARQKVVSQYAEEVVAQKYIDLYESLLTPKTIG